MSDLPPLPADVRALIAAEAAAPAGGDRDAVRARVLASVGIGVAAGTAAGGTAAAAGTASAATATATGTAVATGVAGKLVVVALVAGAIGGGAALVGRNADPPAPRPSPASMTAAPVREPESAPPPPREPAREPEVALPPVRDREVGSRSASARSTAAARHVATTRPSVDDEPTLLHRAWSALAHGDAAAALAAVELDARAHPAGVLAEERDALAIEALLRLSRITEARDRARAFAARYPDSIHRDLVTRALGAPR